MGKIEILILVIIATFLIVALGILFVPKKMLINEDVCVESKLYIKKGEILYPKYGWSEQLTCLNAEVK